MSITDKAQAIIDNLYMYITLVDKELYNVHINDKNIYRL